nr:MAG TPA: hypothetical protein [Inoviridae sp.]
MFAALCNPYFSLCFCFLFFLHSLVVYVLLHFNSCFAYVKTV